MSHADIMIFDDFCGLLAPEDFQDAAFSPYLTIKAHPPSSLPPKQWNDEILRHALAVPIQLQPGLEDLWPTC